MDTTRWGEGFTGPQPTAETPGVPVDEPYAGSALPPDPDSPFEEPAEAPELRQQRSESLYSRSAPFWERVVQTPADGEEYPRDPGYWDHPEEVGEGAIMRVRALRPLEQVQRFLTSRTAVYIYAGLVVLLMMGLFVHNVFATVRTINVVGNSRFTADQVVALSGLEVGMSTFGVDEAEVIERIARERYLRCTRVDVSFDAVTLHVRERVPCCTIVQNGRRIVLDDRGWVLEISDDMNAVAGGLISVTGLDVHHASLGQAVTLRMPARLTAYTQILIELRALGGLYLITELDMTTMDSITLKTSDGLTIQMGNETLIHEKVRALLVVRENLMRNGFYGEEAGGTIVVSDPTSPAYRPPDV